MQTAKRRRRSRYVCSHCLTHTAYKRQQELPEIYCPACRNQDSSNSNTDSTFDISNSDSALMHEHQKPRYFTNESTVQSKIISWRANIHRARAKQN